MFRFKLRISAQQEFSGSSFTQEAFAFIIVSMSEMWEPILLKVHKFNLGCIAGRTYFSLSAHSGERNIRGSPLQFYLEKLF